MEVQNINISTIYDMSVISKMKEFMKSKKNERLNIQPFFIVVEKLLTSGISSFRYKLGERSNQRELETFLSDNDAFVMTHHAIGLYKEVEPNPDAVSSSALGGNSFPLYYPDLVNFPTPATATNVSEAAALEAIYKGFTTAKADQDEVILRLDHYKTRSVPDTQYVAGTTLPSHRGLQFQPLYLPVIFDGNKENNFTFDLAPQADTVQIAGATGTRNVVQILHFGYLVRDYTESATIQQLKKRGIFQ